MKIHRNHDHENFLCTLLLTGDRRRCAFALRAFNVEVSKIGSTVTEDTIGKMKLKFWHDSIDKCYNNEQSYVADNPVLKELKTTITKTKLTKSFLKRLVTSRDRPKNQGFLTTKQMEDYSEQTVSSLYYLLLEVWGVKDLNVDHAISHLGKAQGLTNLLRAIPYRGRSEALNIPQEVLMKQGVSQERIIRDKVGDKAVEECIFEIASVAHQHLEKSRNLSDKVPKEVKQLFLASYAIERYLERLRQVNFRLSDQKVLQRDQMLPAVFLWNKIRCRY
ncbi:NDUFAF6 family protein [Megaselia abdita]